jgi:hypothetical protein
MSARPKEHEMPRSTYTGLPIDRGLNVFHWRAPVEGRKVEKAIATPKTETQLLAFKVAGAITFSQNTQADADKTARLKGKQNNRRSQ